MPIRGGAQVYQCTEKHKKQKLLQSKTAPNVLALLGRVATTVSLSTSADTPVQNPLVTPDNIRRASTLSVRTLFFHGKFKK